MPPDPPAAGREDIALAVSMHEPTYVSDHGDEHFACAGRCLFRTTTDGEHRTEFARHVADEVMRVWGPVDAADVRARALEDAAAAAKAEFGNEQDWTWLLDRAVSEREGAS